MTKIKPYVYQLIHKNTQQFYFGLRCANKVSAESDLGYYYFSSSLSIKSIGFEYFDIIIIKECDTKEEAVLLENALITENWSNPLILNRNIGGKVFRGNEPKSQSHKNNISTAMKLVVHTPASDESKLKMSQKKLGVKRTESFVTFISNYVKHNKLTCPHCGKTGQALAMKQHHFEKCKWILAQHSF